ncbi:PIN domain-containing protein [Kribbella antiqua]|uniref:PIN domain-containing protein n=1 Tax=Kribbella antiqua TaxID=2512217 RepID=A0A4R2IMF4_9ACTN|nr:PIN domain-containing protein [Kribbella antiqua]TCO45149.1 PIN domain-containing protein [Kribbella antiqua]
MTESRSPSSSRPERAFLDANVIVGQLTTNILLSLAEHDVLDPRWSQGVIEEMRRHTPKAVPADRIDRRIEAMNGAFPHAMTGDHPKGLEDQMVADAKDRHVLAAAVYSESDVLVTENVKDFKPPANGPHAMRVEKLSQFLVRKLTEDTERVTAAMQQMVANNRFDPRTMPALLDKMARLRELRAFAQKLNDKVPDEQKGTAPVLTANVRGSAHHAALTAVVPPGTPHAPEATPEASKPTGQSQEKSSQQEL